MSCKESEHDVTQHRVQRNVRRGWLVLQLAASFIEEPWCPVKRGYSRCRRYYTRRWYKASNALLVVVVAVVEVEQENVDHAVRDEQAQGTMT